MAEAVSKFLGLRPFLVESWRAATVQCFRFNGHRRFLLNSAMTRLYGLMGCARLMI